MKNISTIKICITTSFQAFTISYVSETHCIKYMQEYGLSLTRILPYKDRSTQDFPLIDQSIPTFTQHSLETLVDMCL